MNSNINAFSNCISCKVEMKKCKCNEEKDKENEDEKEKEESISNHIKCNYCEFYYCLKCKLKTCEMCKLDVEMVNNCPKCECRFSLNSIVLCETHYTIKKNIFTLYKISK